MESLSLAVLAHVDAGKTTTAEALLYGSGAIRSLGRVDHGDAFFDTHFIERERGITVFSCRRPALSCSFWIRRATRILRPRRRGCSSRRTMCCL